MAQNLIIANATYSNVPAVDISKVGGGTARFVDTSDANATAGNIAKNKTAYVNGQKIVGTNEGGGGTPRTADDVTVSGKTVTVPDGVYSEQVQKSVATATQATPSISVSSSGLITASATQSEGYVSEGTKSGTKQLTTQGAKTVTPTTSEQTAVASGVYTTGEVKVAAIQTETKTATANGDVTPTSGKYLSKVTVAIPVYSGW